MIRLLVTAFICYLILGTGCFYDHLIHIQVGPDHWGTERDHSTTQPASQPAGTTEDRLEKMMELYK